MKLPILQTEVIVSGGSDCLIKIWELKTKSSQSESTPLLTLKSHKSPILCLTTMPFNESTVLVSGGEDTFIKIWDVEKDGDKVIMTLKSHIDSV